MKWTRRGLKVRMLLILSVVGPGIITANVDNDAGGILTYSQAGAQFGYTLLWTFIPTTLALIVIQEMAARMGAASGKGLSDLIREEYGLRITAFMMLGVTLCNLGNVVAEFAGIAASMGLFGVSKYIAVPLCDVCSRLLSSEFRAAMQRTCSRKSGTGSLTLRCSPETAGGRSTNG